MIIGIDPGYRAGGVAIVGDDFAEVHDLPVFEKGGVNAHALGDLLNEDGLKAIYIEQVSAMPKQGVSSVWKFGEGVGAIKAVAALAGVPVHFVTPAKWKQHFRLSREKGEARRYAIQVCPKVEKDLRRVKDTNRAEALLIALYGAAKEAA